MSKYSNGDIHHSGKASDERVYCKARRESFHILKSVDIFKIQIKRNRNLT